MAYISQIKLGPTTYDISAYKLKNARTINLTGAITGSASFDGTTDISINTALSGSHTHDQYLPLTAGRDKKLTGPLGLTENVNYGPDLPSTNTFDGQLFFLEDSGAILPPGGTAGQVLVKNSSVDNDASWTNDIKAMRDGNGNIISSTYLPLAGGTLTGNIYGVSLWAQQASGENQCGVSYNNKNGILYLWGNNSTSTAGLYDSTAGYIIRRDINDGLYVINAKRVYGAVWNDYAEFRICNEKFKPGQVVLENGDDTLSISNQRLQRGCSIVSDTFGFAIGQTNEAKCPIAVSGRVLAYGYESREEFKKHIGWPVCSGPNGTVSIMTEEEEEKYPSRIIGTISAVPDYETWGTGNVEVNNRIWIKVK